MSPWLSSDAVEGFKKEYPILRPRNGVLLKHISFYNHRMILAQARGGVCLRRMSGSQKSTDWRESPLRPGSERILGQKFNEEGRRRGSGRRKEMANLKNWGARRVIYNRLKGRSVDLTNLLSIYIRLSSDSGTCVFILLSSTTRAPLWPHYLPQSSHELKPLSRGLSLVEVHWESQ